MKLKLVLFALMVLFISCKEKYENTAVEEYAYAAGDAVEVATDAVEASADATYENLEEKVFTPADSGQEAKIIKTAVLRFPTDNLNESFSTIQKATKEYKAYVQNDNSGKNYNSTYRNVTIRVPNQNFDAFIADISKGVSYFDRKEISAEDVTAEFVDLEARLKAKKVLESRYLELLKKANKVSEMLEIERELSNIREEIEAKEGRIKYLQNQVGLSTISLQMYTENPAGSGTTVSYGTKMWNAVKSGINGLSSFFLGILNIWPFILILAFAFIFIRKKWKKRRARNEENV